MHGQDNIPTKKAKEKEQKRQTRWQFQWTDYSLQRRLWEQIGTHEGIHEGKTFRLFVLISLSTTNDVHKRSLSFMVCVKHWLSPRIDLNAQLRQGSPNPLHSFTLCCIKTEDNCGIKGHTPLYHSFVNLQSSFLNNFIRLSKRDALLTSIPSSELIPLMKNVANELLHGGFKNSFFKKTWLFKFKFD